MITVSASKSATVTSSTFGTSKTTVRQDKEEMMTRKPEVIADVEVAKQRPPTTKATSFSSSMTTASLSTSVAAKPQDTTREKSAALKSRHENTKLKTKVLHPTPSQHPVKRDLQTASFGSAVQNTSSATSSVSVSNSKTTEGTVN